MFRRALLTTLAPAAVAFSFPMLLSGSGRRGVAALTMAEMQQRGEMDIIPLPSRFLNSSEAREIDEMLMGKPGFSIDQLMELAGLSVAKAAHAFAQDTCYTNDSASKKILIVCGPGNNGGDGLVAARHLRHFGYAPSIVYPKGGKSELFVNLVKQCEDLGIPFVSEENLAESDVRAYGMVIDALFGFSFKGQIREPFGKLLSVVKDSGVPVMSVDIPSGWDVNKGDVESSGFLPEAVISLTAPKKCMEGYEGAHYVGGRFVPPSVESKFQIDLPAYGDMSSAQVARYDSSRGGGEGDGVKEPIESIAVVYVTASSEEEGEKIAQYVIGKKLAACVNVVPKVISHFEWDGKMQKEEEVLLMIKAPKRLIEQLTKAVQQVHSYDVPEVIAMNVEDGSKDYINWVGEMCPPPSNKE